MRKILGTSLLALAIGTAVLPATSASAYCSTLVYDLTGQCGNPCTLAAHGYYTADRTAADALPDVEFICPM